MKAKEGEHPFGDTGQLLLLGVFAVVWIGDSFLLRRSTFLSQYVPLYVRFLVLVLLLVAAVYLSRSGHTVAGGKQPDRVVTTGAFRYVRHPLYLASILTYLGATVFTLSLLSLAVLLGGLVFYDSIAGYEEALLEERFGEEYARYKRCTGKWLPGIGRER